MLALYAASVFNGGFQKQTQSKDEFSSSYHEPFKSVQVMSI